MMAGPRSLGLLGIGILLVFLATGTGTVSASAVCDAASGHYYELVTDPYITWSEARDAAAAAVLEGTVQGYGHLATITSAEENSFVFTQYPGDALSNKWIGGYQPDASAVDTGWQWITGEPWVWTNWNTGEPSNRFYAAYGYENATTYWDGTGKWNDAPQEWQYSGGGYLIEWDGIPALITIRPGSFTTSINPKEQGTVPVAVLGSPALDVTTIDPASITLNGMPVDTRGSGKALKLAYSYEDVNGDGFMDLVAHFRVSSLGLTGSETELQLSASTFDGEIILSADSVNIVPPNI
jgi:hypothetical protein